MQRNFDALISKEHRVLKLSQFINELDLTFIKFLTELTHIRGVNYGLANYNVVNFFFKWRR